MDKNNFYSSYASDKNGKFFHTWTIRFTNRSGESEEWNISDLTLKTNHRKNHFPNKKRLSAKQALTLEFMYNSFDLVGEEVRKEVLYNILPEAEADCFSVQISFHDSNPLPKFYSELRKEPWFNVNDISADAYLQSDLCDFYIDMSIHDYRFGKLSEAEQNHLTESFDTIESTLKNRYGKYADYKIYMNNKLTAEFFAPN